MRVSGEPTVRPTGDAVSILRAHGCRVTEPRRAVLQVLLDHDGPLTAPTIASRASAVVPGIHDATVYRTIAVLTEVGVASHVHVGHGPSLVRLAGDPSLVAVCRSCGAIEQVPVDAVNGLSDRMRAATGFELQLGHFALEGWCTRCHSTADGRTPE